MYITLVTFTFYLFPECYMRLESVKLEKQMILHGKESKCYSVEPVLRCLPGCMSVRTTSVTVGFHCVPAGESEINHSYITKLKDTASISSLTAVLSSMLQIPT